MKRYIMLFLALIFATATCVAQDAEKAAPPSKFYRLDFVVKELEGGKIINSRAYFVTVASQSKSQIRASGQVPYQSSPGNWTQNQIGSNFDCSDVREAPAGVALFVSAQVRSLLEDPSAGTSGRPILRLNEWQSTVLVAIKKPTVIFSSDDLASKRQMQVELTATPIS